MSSAQQSLVIDPVNRLNFTTKNAADEQNKSTDELEIDVVEFLRDVDIGLVEVEDPEGTEYSSSFAETSFSNENCSILSDAEVESQYYGKNDFESGFDAFNNVLPVRRKKLTSHWRNYIRPLMWQCKWMELRIKELESKASKYSREIAEHDCRNYVDLGQFKLDDFSSRSSPCICQSHRRKAMKRNKRKRVENETYIAAYMSHHNLFSWRENWRSDPDGTSNGDDFGKSVLAEQNNRDLDESGMNDDLSLLEDDDSFLEQTLHNIEKLQSQVHKLKTQLDLVISRHAGKFSSSENLSHLVSCNAQTSSIHSPTFSACNGDAISVGGLCTPSHHIPDYDIGDLVMPECTISSYVDTIPIPDITESTVGLLTSADITKLQPQVGDSCENVMDDIFTHDQAAGVERQTSKDNHNQLTEKHLEAEKSAEEQSINPPSLKSEPDTLARSTTSNEQSTLKSCLAAEFHFPKNKRKRGERKAGSGGWSRQCTAKPDSQ